jgi:predicted nucleic acid-binding protein
VTREIVVNAGPLIHLAGIGQFHLLQTLFDSVNIPDAVYAEVVTHGWGQAGASEVATALERGWMRRRTVVNRLAVALLLGELHEGESEAIILAREMGCGVLLDDAAARAAATRVDLAVSGTIGVLLLARRRTLIDSLEPELDKLLASGFRLSRSLYDRLCEDL